MRDLPDAPGRRSLIRRAALAIAVALLVGVVPAGRAAWLCRRDLAGARVALQSGDWRSAHVLARHAAQQVAWNDVCADRAVAQLVDWGRDASRAGDKARALDAWVQARHALGVTRSLLVRDPARQVELDRDIASLLGHPPTAAPAAPDPRWGAAGLAGMALAGGGLAGMAWRGVLPDGAVVPSTLIRWAATALAGATLWLVAVRYA